MVSPNENYASEFNAILFIIHSIAFDCNCPLATVKPIRFFVVVFVDHLQSIILKINSIGVGKMPQAKHSTRRVGRSNINIIWSVLATNGTLMTDK